MSTSSDPVNPAAAELQGLRANWFWFLILGFALIVLGMIAIGDAVIASVFVAMVFGIMLMVGGTMTIASAFWARGWGGVILQALAGALYLVLGFLMATHPVKATEALTLVIAASFLIGGLVRIIIALIQRFRNWGWLFLNGVITFVLGAIIWRQWREWPESTLWVIGMFVGIELIFNGWTWVMLAFAIRSAR